MGITEERIKRITEQAAVIKALGEKYVDVSGDLEALASDNAAMEAEIQGLEEANARLRERLNRGENHEAYLKLPLDADGAAIHVLDAVYFDSEVAKVCGMRWDGANWSLSLHDRAEDTASNRCRLVPTAALIGADGVSIGVGDIVYRDDDPEPLEVDLIYAGSMGYCTVRLKNSAGIYTSADAPRLSHKKPEPLEPDPADSWEKLEEDAAKEVCAYAGAPFSIVDQDRYSCTGCRFDDCSSRKTSCWLQMNSELMARAKKLAGIEEEAQR